MDYEAELAYADEVGRHFARQNGLPTMTGRVAGWLLICDPPQQTIAELGEALRASRTAVSGAVSMLEEWSWIQRSRAAGERVDRVSIHSSIWLRMVDKPSAYTSLGALAHQGLKVLGEASPARRARLLEGAAFAEFLVERMPALAAEWRERRDALRASGELPDDTGTHRP
ncbi:MULTISPECIES: GbsR/MarR family transcriptional regulator [unclassified Streptosporangium]|uniref:GbsR/MarR family transcriptional regulator n=1 Tax=unclassified Streptosporangium TaxID=2632669 RepID=UPI002E27EBAA|nr:MULTISPECIES: MarR family transcriptional regulator [unclassified Streptosporangium]